MGGQREFRGHENGVGGERSGREDGWGGGGGRGGSFGDVLSSLQVSYLTSPELQFMALTLPGTIQLSLSQVGHLPGGIMGGSDPRWGHYSCCDPRIQKWGVIYSVTKFPPFYFHRHTRHPPGSALCSSCATRTPPSTPGGYKLCLKTPPITS